MNAEIPNSSAKPTVFSIGHSNHPIEDFLGLLRRMEISAVADVRSVPYSKRHPQYRKAPLARTLKDAGIAYVFLGKELGARPDDQSCYVDGRADYDRIAATDAFEEGLRRVEAGAHRHRIALMCAEREPLDCHRTLLVSRHLIRRAVPIQHILPDGSLESGQAAEERLATAVGLAADDLFFDAAERIEEAYRRRISS